MKRDCLLCLGPCDAEIHAATLSLHRWFKGRIGRLPGALGDRREEAEHQPAYCAAVEEPIMSSIKLREIPFGPCGDADELCIYAVGTIDHSAFLGAVRTFSQSDVPKEVREALTVEDVEYIRFRPMSPSDARGYGYDSGVMRCDEKHGYAVTAVTL